MSNCALQIKHVSKEYKLYDKQADRLKEAFHPFKKVYHKKFYALDDVDFDIQKGEKVGIIGANGAGKSTLLKMITGVLNPSQGEIVTDGKIAALLELGAGFNSEYTGIENIRLNGTLMGMSEKEVEEKMQSIIDFADIGDFINQPVKSYSSGMFVRLAFATQIFSEPDILIVDEALSVGDIRFQQKCYRAMESIMENRTVVLVTHDTAAVARFCKRVIWINKGKVMYDGEVAEGLKRYQEFLINQAIEEKGEAIKEETTSAKKTEAEQSTDVPAVPAEIAIKGTKEAVITHCGFFDEKGNLIENIEPLQKVTLVSYVNFKNKVEHPIHGITMRDRLGNVILELNSEMLGQSLPNAEGKEEYHIEFVLPPLNKGEYTISVAVAKGYQEDHVQLCWMDDVCVFKVPERQYDLQGFLYLTEGNIIETSR